MRAPILFAVLLLAHGGAAAAFSLQEPSPIPSRSSPSAAATAAGTVLSATTDTTVARAQLKADRQAVQRQMDGSSVVGDAAGEHYEVTLEGSTKDKKAVASAAWTNEDASRTFELKTSTPLSDGTEEVEPLSFGGLPDGTTGTFTLQQFSWAEDGYNRRLKRIVCELGAKKWPCDAKDLRDTNNIPILHDLSSQFRSTNASGRSDICAVVLASGGVCRVDGANDLTNVNLHRAYLRFSGASNDPHIAGLSGTVGRKKFDFLDKDTLQDMSSSHNTLEASGYWGRYAPSNGLLLVRAGYKRKWKAGQAKPDDVCRPIPGTTALKCKVIAIGGPKTSAEFIGSVEWRRFKRGGKLAIDPILSHDVKNNVTELQASVYFLPGDKGLTGGVRGSWQADWRPDPGQKKHTFTASVFVGVAALGILP